MSAALRFKVPTGYTGPHPPQEPADRAVAATDEPGAPNLVELLESTGASAITGDTSSPEVANRLEKVRQRLGDFAPAHRALVARTLTEILESISWPYAHHYVEKALQNPGTDDEAPIAAAPVLDNVALHGPVGDWVRLVQQHTEAAPAALLTSALVAIGALIGRAPSVTLDGARHGINLFALLIGPTSSGRKGTAVAWARRLLRMLDENFLRVNMVAGLSSGEGIIHALRDARDADASGKGADPGIVDKRLLVVEGEFSSVLRVQRRDGNILSAILREAWDGFSLHTLTKGSPQVASDPHVAVIGQITPEELRRRLEEADVFDGYLNRFLFCWCERAQVLPFGSEPDAGEERVAVGRIVRAVGTARSRGPVEAMTAAARTWWGSHYEALTTGRPGRVGAATQRGAAQVRRLALLYAVIDEERTLDVPHLEAALALWRYCEGTAALVLGTSELSNRAMRLAEALLAAGEAGMDREMIRAEVGSNNVSAKDIAAALRELRDAGTAGVTHDHGTGGRPREVWISSRYLLGRNGRNGKKGGEPSAPSEGLSSHSSHNSLESSEPERCPGCGGSDLTWTPEGNRCEACARARSGPAS